MAKIITLLTDFGTQDEYVVAMKGVLLSQSPDLVIVDATHDLPPQDVQHAAWVLRGYYHLFPMDTIHMAVVDPGVGTERKALIMDADHHLFIAPDNGVLYWVAEKARTVRCYEILPEVHRPGNVSATFHGRDVFAFAAGRLAVEGTDALKEVAKPLEGEMADPEWGRVLQEGRSLKGQIIHVDSFGNLITNITSLSLQDTPDTEVDVILGDRHVCGLSATYEQTETGGLLALYGSSGHVEVCINGGSAADTLKLRRGDGVEITF